jgi:hypothetical protein
VDYLYSQVVEYRESAQDVTDILSHDWKNKIAASLIPRGLEMSNSFTKRLRLNFHNIVFEKVVSEAKEDEQLKHIGIEGLMRSHKREMHLRSQEICTDVFWDRLLNDIEFEPTVRVLLEDKYTSNGKLLNRICPQIIDFAKKAYAYNKRVSSELYNQPKPVDSVVDDFAVEAQNFANSLTLSAAFSSGALALRLLDESTANMVSAILGVLNIAISFGTMTNVARYKIRNEEARIVIADEKLQSVKEAVFALFDESTRESFSLDLNPFYTRLEKKVEKFQQLARYYDYKEPREFNTAYTALKSHINDINHIKTFRKLIVCKFVVSSYHVNSYIQEALVDVCRTLTDMLRLLAQPLNRSIDIAAVRDLFCRLNALEPRLEKSLQRGPVLWGFLKQRRFVHWDVVVSLRYFYSLLWSPRCRGNSLSPIQNEIHDTLRGAQRVSKKHHNTVLRREVRDLETLYWATRESDIASIIFVSASLTFAASVVFTVARIFSIDALNNFSFFATATSAMGAVLAAFHFVRKSRILTGLWFELRDKAAKAADAQKMSIKQIETVTAMQIFLTLTRLGAAGAAAVALPFAVAENGFSDSISTNELLPFWIAFGAVLTAVIATIFFFVVEYIVRYVIGKGCLLIHLLVGESCFLFLNLVTNACSLLLVCQDTT